MCFLSNTPFDRFSLAIHPSDQIFLKASILRATSGGLGGGRPDSAQRCTAKVLLPVFEPILFCHGLFASWYSRAC